MGTNVIASLPNVVKRSIQDPTTGEEREYFVGTLRSDLAKALTFVPVREESKRTYLTERMEDGYQRPGSATRMRIFATYLRDNPLSVVPPVILSGRNEWRFVGKGDVGEIEVSGPAAIVDGQHRVGGFVCSFETDDRPRNIDFILLVGLTLKEEIDEFVAINNTQKGVPKSLTVLLENSDDANLALALDEDEGSPFHDRIAQVAKKSSDLFTLAAVAKNIGRTFAHGAFEGASIDTKLDLLVKYWDCIAAAFPDEWADMDSKSSERVYKLLETTGLIAWSLAAEDILGPAYDSSTATCNWAMVEARIARLAADGALDWRKDGEFQGLTGEVGGARIHRKMQALLAQGIEGEIEAEVDED